MFTGVTTGIWQTARLMQWDGVRWNRLEVETNRDKYMLALNDLTAGAPDGIFSTAFIRTLFVDMVHVQVLNVLCQLNIGNFANGIQIDGRSGQIRGGDPDAGMGVRIESNGKATFRNITVRGDSSFEGDIVSGPLELNNKNSATPDTIIVHNQGESTRAFSDWIDDRRLPIATNGTFGAIAFSWIDRRRTGPITTTCRLLNRDRNEVASFPVGPDRGQNQSGTFPIFPQRLQIGFFNQQGRTFKLNNLPLNEPNLRGAIWQDSEGYLRIVR